MLVSSLWALKAIWFVHYPASVSGRRITFKSLYIPLVFLPFEPVEAAVVLCQMALNYDRASFGSRVYKLIYDQVSLASRFYKGIYDQVSLVSRFYKGNKSQMLSYVGKKGTTCFGYSHSQRAAAAKSALIMNAFDFFIYLWF